MDKYPERVTICMSEEMRRQLEEQARHEERSVSNIVRLWIMLALEAIALEEREE